MFIGHFGLALAAKKIAPRTSLGALFLAAEFADFIWPIFLLLGIEHVRIAPGITTVTPLDFYDYPISHSLLTLTLWSAMVGGAYYLVTRYRRGEVSPQNVRMYSYIDATHVMDFGASHGGVPCQYAAKPSRSPVAG